MGIYNKIDALIKESMLNKETKRVQVLRLIKSEIVRKIKDGNEYDEALEVSVLNKMISQREDSIEQFKKANRLDLAENEFSELEIIKEYAPKPISDEEIQSEVINVVKSFGDDYSLTMKDMKKVMSLVKEKYPSANGKIVSDFFKTLI